MNSERYLYLFNALNAYLGVRRSFLENMEIFGGGAWPRRWLGEGHKPHVDAMTITMCMHMVMGMGNDILSFFWHLLENENRRDF